ncbi:3-deoxy-D-manno-octulosonic acid transferase [Pseudorhodobacter aquimaris]|uniref:3-deoxy-D-manno-octulosonic acid transferase n=1 Tax=Pseudorhodobacter aquimaris TaxID=687412 RepID=UPI00067C9C48|nr:glycosyltransferase N-terminal domain-containing protein [Pseudorhodobacter aquimaris]
MDKPRSPTRALRAYMMLTRMLAPLAPMHLRRRLAQGREDPARWQEKLGQAGRPRPKGRLIWLHGVGVGEVMALRGLIAAMGRADPRAHFLITSSARSSAQVVAGNLPPRSIHQYLPIDAPAFVARFLEHWQPDLSIWSDQEIWPVCTLEADRRGIPLVFLNARITDQSLEKKRFIKPLYEDVLRRFQLVLAQDSRSAANLKALGASAVEIAPSMKSAAPMLAVDEAELARMRAMFDGRRIWVAASTHPEDEAVALAAQAQLFADDPRWLLVLVPRDPKRELLLDQPFARRSAEDNLTDQPVYLADSFGELGLWYRLADAALIGGSFSAVEGHNPWEASALGTAVLHGPRIENFANDFNALHMAQAAKEITDAASLVRALKGDLAQMGLRGQSRVRRAAPLDGLAKQLLGMAK